MSPAPGMRPQVPWEAVGPHQQFRGSSALNPHVGGHNTPGFHSVVEVSRGNNSLIPFLNQGQETTCKVHRRLLPLPGCPCADLLLPKTSPKQQREAVGWNSGWEGDVGCLVHRAHIWGPSLYASVMSLDTFKSWLTELQNKLRPNALCFHPRLAQNAKLSVLLLIIQQLQSLPTFLLSEKLNELSLSLFMREREIQRKRT